MLETSIHFIPAASFSTANIAVISAPASLSRWVQCFWLVSDPQKNRQFIKEKVYPDAGTSLTFTINSTGASAQFFYNTQVFFQRWNMSNNYVSVRFKPGGAYALLGLNINDLANQEIDFKELSIAHRHQLNALLDLLPILSATEQLQLLQDWLIALSANAQIIHHQLDSLLIQTSNNLLIPREFANSIGMSCRTLERHVHRHLGSTPNQLRRYAQIHHARRHLMAANSSISDVALSCGYFDQAHFTNAFYAHSLETPLQYRKRKLSQISN